MEDKLTMLCRDLLETFMAPASSVDIIFCENWLQLKPKIFIHFVEILKHAVHMQTKTFN